MMYFTFILYKAIEMKYFIIYQLIELSLYKNISSDLFIIYIYYK